VVDGGTDTWHATRSNWTDSEDETNGLWTHDFAVFQGNAGIVTVDNSLGNIRANDMQFAVDSYVVDGDAVTLEDAAATIRVGVGTSASQSMTATIAATFSSARDTVLSAGYATVDTLAATTLTLAGTMSGQGSLVKHGDGTLVLAGASSYAGNTLVQAGTLKGDAARIRGHLLNDAITIFEQITDAAFNGNVSGEGTAVKDGAGILSLAGTSTAAWRIDEGVLRAEASRFISGSVAITADGTINFDQALDATYAGVLSGAGTLRKRAASCWRSVAIAPVSRVTPRLRREAWPSRANSAVR
jgi:autotransporter-associated beta strand protein